AFVTEGIKGNDTIISEIVKSIGRNRYNKPFIDFKLKQFRQSATPEARLGYLEMFSQNDISGDIKGLKTPYHVIIGSQDSEWHSREVMENTFAKFYPNCIISEIADASHYPMQETPILLASLIEGFLLNLRSKT